MPNGEILEELRLLAREEKIEDTPFRRLMLACMEEQLNTAKSLTAQITALEKTICENPAYKLGETLRKNPKLATALVIFILVVVLGELSIMAGYDLSGLIHLFLP